MDMQLAIGLATVLLAALALYFAYVLYGIYRYRRSGIGWLAVTVSLAFMLVRRILDVASSYFQPGQLQLAELFSSYEWALLWLISLMQIYAFWKIKSAHDEEKRVDEETMMRIRSFEAGRMRGAKKGRGK